MKYTVPYGGERLDRIADAIYGTALGGTVEALLDANPGLALLCYPTGDVPEYTELLVPDVQPVVEDDGIVLAWE